MIIPTLIPPLLEETAAVFAQPERYGLSALAQEGLALLEILEALLPSPQWEWLTADDLAPALRKSDRFQLREDRVVYTGPDVWLASFRATMRAAIAMAEKVPSELILAFPKRVLRQGSQARRRSISRIIPKWMNASQDSSFRS